MIGASLLAFACTLSPALAHPPIAATQAAATFEQDRADILAMAGNYKVRSTCRNRPAGIYTQRPASSQDGNEVVRVIEDTSPQIVLNMLVIEHEGASHIIKHWRQDWEYELARVLVYADRGLEMGGRAREMRTGRWSQTVAGRRFPRYKQLGAVRDAGRRAPLALQLDNARSPARCGAQAGL